MKISDHKQSTEDNMDPFTRILDQIRDGYVPTATKTERQRALSVYLDQITKLLQILKPAGHPKRGSMQLEIAHLSVFLASQDLRQDPQNHRIDFDGLDRGTLLLSLCETIVACMSLSQALDMDLAGAVARVSKHVSIDGNGIDTRRYTVRSPHVQLPFAKLVMREFV